VGFFNEGYASLYLLPFYPEPPNPEGFSRGFLHWSSGVVAIDPRVFSVVLYQFNEISHKSPCLKWSATRELNTALQAYKTRTLTDELVADDRVHFYGLVKCNTFLLYLFNITLSIVEHRIVQL
jgi:hypothetical protein